MQRGFLPPIKYVDRPHPWPPYLSFFFFMVHSVAFLPRNRAVLSRGLATPDTGTKEFLEDHRYCAEGNGENLAGSRRRESDVS